MPVETVTQYGPIAGAFASGCAAAWAFANRVMVPARLKALEDRVQFLQHKIEELQEKAHKYDALNERLAKAQLAKLE